MTSLSLTKPITFGRRKTDAVTVQSHAVPGALGGIPRANLLPPSVLALAHGRRVMRGMLVAVACAVAVAVAGSAAAGVFAMSRGTALAEERAVTDSLLAEQLEYSDVSTTLTSIATLDGAREAIGATDVLWADYLQTVRAVVPSGVSITGLTLQSTSPTTVVVTGASALSVPSVATLSLTTTSSDLASVTAWMDDLAALPGSLDAMLGTVSLSPSGLYEAVVTLSVDQSIYSNRFAAEVAE